MIYADQELASDIFDPIAAVSPSSELHAGWISAGPAAPRVTGPFSVSELSDGRAVGWQPAAVGADALTDLEPNVQRICDATGFSMVREDGFPDQVFVARGLVAVAYETVAEHLLRLRPADIDVSGRVLDPILSMRTLSMVVHREAFPAPDGRVLLGHVIDALEQCLLQTDGMQHVTLDRGILDATSSIDLRKAQGDWLRARWRELVMKDLPAVTLQRRWPVSEDHCFARILLDNACGRPWRETIAPPAWRNAPDDILMQAIMAGDQVLTGDVDLDELNDRSLEMRGKCRG